MRAVLLSVMITCALVVSGCLGADDVDGENLVQVEAVAGLQTAIQSPALGEWVVPGESIEVTATPPANAVGNVTYTWAVQQDPVTLFSEVDDIDTGPLLAGESGDLIFDAAGFYEYGHCDPHPWMKHTVAVMDGFDGPDHVTVYIVEEDLGVQDSWVFVPEHITIATGTTVTYTNLGQLMHTASIAHAGEVVASPRLLDLKEASGTVTLDGSDWMNLLVFVEDEAGNGGYAKGSFYVHEHFPTYSKEDTGMFEAAWPDALGAPPSAELDKEDVHTHQFDWKGTVTLNLTLDDPTETLNQVNVFLRETQSDAVPDPQVLFESGATGSDTFTVPITRAIKDLALKYEVVVVPAQGVLIGYTLEVTIDYDYTPLELVRLPCPEPHYSQGHC